MTDEKRIYIAEAAELLNRRPHTIRSWEYNGLLPEELKPNRDSRGWRYWTEAQVAAVKRWLVDANIHPGSGLPGYKPNQAQIQSHNASIRAAKNQPKEPVAA